MAETPCPRTMVKPCTCTQCEKPATLSSRFATLLKPGPHLLLETRLQRSQLLSSRACFWDRLSACPGRPCLPTISHLALPPRPHLWHARGLWASPWVPHPSPYANDFSLQSPSELPGVTSLCLPGAFMAGSATEHILEIRHQVQAWPYAEGWRGIADWSQGPSPGLPRKHLGQGH